MLFLLDRLIKTGGKKTAHTCRNTLEPESTYCTFHKLISARHQAIFNSIFSLRIL